MGIGIQQKIKVSRELVSVLRPGHEANVNNALLWMGPSHVNGEMIAVVATGFTDPSGNKKTGPMVQISIIPAFELPTIAYTAGRDVSVCGRCPLRSKSSGGTGACYVTIFHAPNAAGKALRGGKFWDCREEEDQRRFFALAKLRKFRFRKGSYGDPALMPIELLSKLSEGDSTGYSHQWEEEFFDETMFSFLMASCETVEQAQGLHARGIRTARLSADGSDLLKNEIVCPNQTKGVQCFDCLLCDGTKPNDKRKSIVFLAHGASKKSLVKFLAVIN